MAENQPTTPQPWRETARRNFIRLLGAQHLLGMAGLMRSRLMAERLVRKQQNGTLGEATTEPMDEALENMDLRIGDTYNLPPKSSLSPLAAAVLAGALGAGGATLAPWLLGLLDRPAQPPATSSDTDTQYELRFHADDAN